MNRKDRIRKDTKEFIANVEDFLRVRGGGTIPPEWACSVKILQVYYEQFITITEQVNDLDSFVVSTKNGSSMHPLLKAQAQASQRVESMMKELGLTLKSARKMELIEPKKEQTALDKFISKTNKGIEQR